MDGIASSWVDKQCDTKINLISHVQGNTHQRKHCEVLLPIKDFSTLHNCLGIKTWRQCDVTVKTPSLVLRHSKKPDKRVGQKMQLKQSWRRVTGDTGYWMVKQQLDTNTENQHVIHMGKKTGVVFHIQWRCRTDFCSGTRFGAYFDSSPNLQKKKNHKTLNFWNCYKRKKRTKRKM